MREDSNSIANRLAALHVPPALISVHLKKLEKWRRNHPPKQPSLKRHRLNGPDDDDDSNNKRKRHYGGTRAVFRKGSNRFGLSSS